MEGQDWNELERAAADQQGGGEALPPLPPLWKRVIDVFFQPGELMAALARQPRWFGSFLIGAVLVGLAAWLIPAEVYQETFRAMSLESGREMPPQAAQFARIGGLVMGPITWLIYTMVLASVATVLFAFVLGDEGRFKQYLSATSHALLIPAVGGLVTVPLRIMAGDFRMTLSLGSVLSGFLSPGYLLNLLRGVDMFLLLGLAVLAVGAGKIDRRRGWGSAFGSLLLFSLLLSAVFAFFQ